MGLLNDEFDYLNEAKEELKPVIEESKPEEIKPEVKQEGKKEEPVIEENSSLFVIKVTTNKEARAFELISDRVHSKKLDVYAIARPQGLRGYLFLEAKDRENAEEASFNLPYVSKIIPQKLVYSEIKSLLEPVIADINIEKDDIVEIISEPFKKEKAKVTRVDKAKGEVVVSLLGAIIPIPVTVKIDNVRVIRREDLENS